MCSCGAVPVSCSSFCLLIELALKPLLPCCEVVGGEATIGLDMRDRLLPKAAARPEREVEANDEDILASATLECLENKP